MLASFPNIMSERDAWTMDTLWNVASSNDTARFLLGGRAKSWMTPGPAARNSETVSTQTMPKIKSRRSRPAREAMASGKQGRKTSDKPAADATSAVSSDPILVIAPSTATGETRRVTELRRSVRELPARRETAHSQSNEQAVSSNKDAVPTRTAVPTTAVQPPTGSSGRPAWSTQARQQDPGPQDLFDPQRCTQLLRAFFDAPTSLTGQSKNTRDGRLTFMLIENAIQQGDHCFLFFHQLLCLSVVDSTKLPQRGNDKPLVYQALGYLDSVLWGTHNMDRKLLDFLAAFPAPMRDIAEKNLTTWQAGARAFLNFARKMSSHWEPLREECHQKSRLPLVHELIDKLGITSRTLQIIFFSNLLRSVWSIGDSPWMRRAFLLFDKDQNDWNPVVQDRDRPTINAEAFKVYCAWFEKRYRLLLHVQRIYGSLPEHQVDLTRFKELQDLHNSPIEHLLRASGLAPVHTALFPPPRYALPQHRAPDPRQMALHQAHLTDPRLDLVNLPLGTTPKDCFQFLSKFAVMPLSFDGKKALFNFFKKFTITEDQYRHVARDSGNDPVRTLTQGVWQYRVRSVRKGNFASAEDVTKNWAVTETSWHPFVYVRINDRPLEIRRKVHHGKDLPIDITPFVKVGVNTVSFCANVLPGDVHPLSYLFAVEIIDITTAAAVRNLCENQALISAAESLERIKRSISGGVAADGDDLIVVGSTIDISLLEPFSKAKIFDIPVRGKHCVHRECFDLETFLRSRPSYRDHNDGGAMGYSAPGIPGVNKQREKAWRLEREVGPSEVDCWACPICKADARPQNLELDGWLVDVRQELQRMGKLDVKTITVNAKGEWEPKKEAGEDKNDSGEGDSGVATAGSSAMDVDYPASTSTTQVTGEKHDEGSMSTPQVTSKKNNEDSGDKEIVDLGSDPEEED